MATDHPDEATLVQKLKSSISGFKPTMTGGICDTCNQSLLTENETDFVYVYASWNGDWRVLRTNCQQCGDYLDDREAVEAIVKCELGPSNDGEFHPLYNPEIVELNTSNGKTIRKQ